MDSQPNPSSPARRLPGDTIRRTLSSIRFRLALWFVLLLGIVLLLFSIYIYTAQARELQRQAVERLEATARRLLSDERLSPEEGDEHTRPLPNLSGGTSSGLTPEDAFALIDLQGQVIQTSGSVSLSELQGLFANWIRGDGRVPAYATMSGSEGKYVFLIELLVASQERGIYLALGRPLDPTNQLPRLLLSLVLGGSVLLVLALAGGYWLADRAMRPVKMITQTARQIGETDLSRRLNLETSDELGQLADTFDQMLERLQAAFERQRQFTADASHELRTPLTIVNLEASRALAARRSTGEYRRALAVIKSENEWMTRLVNNLLTLSRMDAQQISMHPEALDLSELALDALERLMPVAAQKDITIEAGELPNLPITGDSGYLSQMLINLLDNAVKHNQSPGTRVRLETGADRSTGRDWAWVRIEDNGPGIPPEHLPHLFERFYRVDQARVRSLEEPVEAASGSGLGLAIVDWIVKAHQGTITVSSIPGSGTTFEVRLPM